MNNLQYTKVIEKYVPRDKRWTHSTLEGIEINMGLSNGEFHSYVLNGTAPNVLMTGITGSGKSVATHVTLATMMKRYSPHELRLVLIDPKGTEFGDYQNTGLHVKTVPSGFDYLLEELENREKLFTESDVRNITEYRVKQGDNLPRILVVIDELGALLPDDKTIDAVDKITKVGRALGIHLWVSTQSAEGILSSDIISRFGLRMTSHNGQLTVDSSNEETTRLFEVPSMSNEDIKANIKELQQFCFY